MKHMAIAMGLAAAIAAAGAVFMHGDTAFFTAQDDNDKVVDALVANVQNEAGDVPAAVALANNGEMIRPTRIASTNKLSFATRPGDEVPVDVAQPVDLNGLTLEALNACAGQADIVEIAGELPGGSLHDLSAYAACGETVGQKLDSAPSIPASFAEAQSPETLSPQWNNPSGVHLRPRFGHALGPAQEAFDLLKPGSAPPASSGVQSTSDYRPT